MSAQSWCAGGVPAWFCPDNYGAVHQAFSSDLFSTESASTEKLLMPFPKLCSSKVYRVGSPRLTRDVVARRWWIASVAKNIPLTVARAIESASTKFFIVDSGKPESSTPTDDVMKQALLRTELFSREFPRLLQGLESSIDEDSDDGDRVMLAVFSLRERLLRDLGFMDPYVCVKEKETAASLKLLPCILSNIDSLSSDRDRVTALINGMLVGNIFDWGSPEVIDRINRDLDLTGFQEMVSTLSSSRPYFIDDTDAFTTYLLKEICSQKSPSKSPKIIIFCDNAGCDLVLGILPFASFLLSRGARVCLAANTYPSLNDITASELRHLLSNIKSHLAPHAFLYQAWRDGLLTVLETGSGLPVVDLNYISPELHQWARDVDLVILEGMGRSLLTNWETYFSCPVLKIASIKNSFAANRLGCSLLSAICRFDNACQCCQETT